MPETTVAPFRGEPKTKRYERLRQSLRTERASFETVWRDLGDHILPYRVQFSQSDRNRGDRRNLKIIDSTPSIAARTCASGMHSGMTHPARPWFKLAPRSKALAEAAGVKAWLHDVEEVLNGIFHRSNLYQVLPVVYADAAVFGVGAMTIHEDDEDVIRCFDHPIGTYYLALDAKRRVRVFVEEFSLTVRQLVEQFGEFGRDGAVDLSKFSMRVQNLWRNETFDAWIEVCQVIEQNRDYNPDRLDSRFKRYVSCYYEIGGEPDKTLRETGFDEFPTMALRWDVAGNNVYGTNSPGITALGDCKQLQLGEKRGAQALDKMVNPPMVAPPAAMNVKLSMLPGDVSYVQESERAQVRAMHEVNLALDALEAKQEQKRNLIRRAFFEDLFLMMAYTDAQTASAQPPTATEVQERKEEKFLVLGPVLERSNQDLLGPTIDRTFGIAARRGLIPSPPPELEGEELRIEYVSILAQAQKRVSLAGLDELAIRVQRMRAAAPEDPSVGDKFDTDQYFDELGDTLGVSPRVIRSDEDVAAMRESRAEAQRQAQAVELAEREAAAAKMLSETDVEKPSALRLLADGAGRGAAA